MIFNRLLAFACISVVLFSACQNNPGSRQGKPLAIPPLVYTKHARCRMECRHINEQEIHDVIEENNINERKSNAAGNPCPTDAYEGFSKEGQHLRIVIAKCEANWKVVTCIDLEHEFECDCH
jgi:hypothetical protein